MRRSWRTQVTVGVPRLRPSAAGWQPSDPIGDRELAQLVCALRLVLPDVGIVLSTRESPELRDGLFRIGVTHASAGSHTEPGGYTNPNGATEQFEVADLRSPAEVAATLAGMGYEPVWEDWSTVQPATGSMLSGRLR
jgi:2-iminoacetate synthase